MQYYVAEDVVVICQPMWMTCMSKKIQLVSFIYIVIEDIFF
jgi:hypothetical protein